jgi:hypothetical protein
MERHVYPQPARAIRTEEFLYIRNVDIDKWPTIEQVAPHRESTMKKVNGLPTGKGFR